MTESTKNLTITFHADWCNRGMAGLASTVKVYAHTGVITNLSKTNADWRYCTSNWNTPQEKFRMTNAGTNLGAKFHDYSGGEYLITIYTKEKSTLFRQNR